MTKRQIFRLTFVFLGATAIIFLLYTGVNLLDFFIKGVFTIPVYAYIIYAIGSALALVSLAIACRKLKKTLLGIATWMALTALLIITYILITTWDKFVIFFYSIYSSEIITGFLLATIVMAFSIATVAIWGDKLTFSKGKKKSK
ncbi:MAG: hypothetical protein ACI4VH_05105 [Clostridia bacterium]